MYVYIHVVHGPNMMSMWNKTSRPIEVYDSFGGCTILHFHIAIRIELKVALDNPWIAKLSCFC